MAENYLSRDQADLYADMAEMYFLEGKTQAEIAGKVGINRSMVSRMLSEARRNGIVEVSIHRPLSFDRELQQKLASHFNLHTAYVLDFRQNNPDRQKAGLAEAGVYALKKFLTTSSILGLAWGSMIYEIVKAFRTDQPLAIKIVQLVGAIGAQRTYFDGHWLVQCLSEKLNGEGFYLNAPFRVDNAEIAHALIRNPSISATINLWKRVNIGLFGIGTIDAKYSSFYNAGFVNLDELEKLIAEGSVGDVCGLQFDLQGRAVCLDFENRLITIPRKDLLNIPIRLGVAGGPGKTEAILGALRGGYINALVTDSVVAKELLLKEEMAS